MSIVSKIKRNVRDYGVSTFLVKSLQSLLFPLFVRRSYLMYRIDLRTVAPRILNTETGFEFRFISSDETDLIAQIEKMEEWLRGKIANYLQDGHKCLVALQETTVAGFNLIDFKRIHIPLINMSKPLRTKECFSVQITVNHKFRGKNIGTELRFRIFEAMKEAGYWWMYGGTQLSNSANRALTKKVGFREVAIATFTRILFCSWTTYSRIPKT